jgi:hypothetical protein
MFPKVKMNCPKVLNDVYIYVGSVCSVLKCRIVYVISYNWYTKSGKKCQKWKKVPKVATYGQEVTLHVQYVFVC